MKRWWPSELDYQIAAARLQQVRRDCKIGFGDGQVWVQIFTPSDPAPSKSSRITEASTNLIEEVLPGFTERRTCMKNDDGCAGFVLSSEEILRVRNQLKIKYSPTEPTAKPLGPNSLTIDRDKDHAENGL